MLDRINSWLINRRNNENHNDSEILHENQHKELNKTNSHIVTDDSKNFWFDYKTWCILFEINFSKISSITEFISTYTADCDENFTYEKSLFFKMETDNANYRLIREDAERFRPYVNCELINYPIIPNLFYGINNIQELLIKDDFCFDSNKISFELYESLNIDAFIPISKLNITDRIVIVTITICEYLNCSYLQGMHDIVGCLAFLKTNPVPIVYHILLTIEIIKRWGPFLILPNLFEFPYEISLEELYENQQKKSIYDSYIDVTNKVFEGAENIFGFIYNILILEDYYLLEVINEPETIFGSLFAEVELDNFQNFSEVNSNVNFFNQSRKNSFQKSTLKEFKNLRCNTIEQLIIMCDEFQTLGNFHIPNIFKDIEKFIGSNIWCCNIFVTCGSSLFKEVPNVLLFWLNLLFSTPKVFYKPPYYPNISISLQIPVFLLTVLKACEYKLKEDIYLICTDQFKLDQEINLRIGIVSILQPFLIPTKKLRKNNISIKRILENDSILESIKNEKKSTPIDLFQIILAMDNLLCLTPFSLQKRIVSAFAEFNFSQNIELKYSKYLYVNFLKANEFMFYDSNFKIKKKKGTEGIKTIISGKDIVLIDTLSSFFLDNIQGNNIEKIVRKFNQIEQSIINKKITNNKLGYEDITKLFDEELCSIILLPILRCSLKTIRIIKIPVEKEKEYYFASQVLQQFLEFSSRRQRALTTQNRPCLWVLLTPANTKMTDDLISRLFNAGITGLQLIDSSSLFCELLRHNSIVDLDIVKIIQETTKNLNMGNYNLNYKSRVYLKNKLLNKKDADTNNRSQVDSFAVLKIKDEDLKSKNIKCVPDMGQESIYKNKIVKFKPNRRKKKK